jgi:hypothetical protein
MSISITYTLTNRIQVVEEYGSFSLKNLIVLNSLLNHSQNFLHNVTNYTLTNIMF